ncbi:MAG TPA: RimK family protein [Phycisphaerales bacterium]|nr:RimK family protein [Phycisphaerales bacterium]
MAILLVLDNPKDWPLNIEGVEVVSARRYLTDPSFSDRHPHKVFNLCKSYRYQSLGYYVSLLAAARGHKPLPEISTIQDLKLSEIVRVAGQDLDEEIQKALKKCEGDSFILSIYFGQNMEEEYNPLALAIFNQFPAPFLRAQFRKDKDAWVLEGLRTIPSDEIPAEHFLDVLNFATHYFNRPHRKPRQQTSRYDMALLYTKGEPNGASDEKAIKKFIKAGESMGIDVEIITKDDYGRIAEFDALFIRDNTNVTTYPFRFARRAAAEGLIVIDDPDSILRCSNKVYISELLTRHKIAAPPTLTLHRDNWQSGPDVLGLPIILKQPDSSFSLGVKKVNTREDYAAAMEKLFKVSDLIIAQAFTPTSFDWRIGVLDREPFYACKYYMAGQHWQIYDNSKKGDDAFGNFETWPIDAVPGDVVKTAIRVANLIGDSLYGVDVKEINGKAHVIEINDNPNLDAGIEDQVLGDEVYLRVMRVFLKRLESRGR